MSGDDLRDRYAARLDDDDDDDEGDGNAQTEKPSKKEKNAKNVMLAENVKESWTATSVYLPGFLNRRLKTRYKRLDLEFEESFGESLPKTRHYYPAVVALGLEQLESMEPQEVQEVIERMEREAREE